MNKLKNLIKLKHVQVLDKHCYTRVLIEVYTI